MKEFHWVTRKISNILSSIFSLNCFISWDILKILAASINLFTTWWKQIRKRRKTKLSLKIHTLWSGRNAILKDLVNWRLWVSLWTTWAIQIILKLSKSVNKSLKNISKIKDYCLSLEKFKKLSWKILINWNSVKQRSLNRSKRILSLVIRRNSLKNAKSILTMKKKLQYLCIRIMASKIDKFNTEE